MFIIRNDNSYERIIRIDNPYDLYGLSIHINYMD